MFKIGGSIETLIVDDVKPVREMLKEILAQNASFKIIGTAGNTWEVRQHVDKIVPALILLDEIIPGEPISSLLDYILPLGAEVILLTGMDNPSHPVHQKKGVLGRVKKPPMGGKMQDQVRFLDDVLKTFQRGS